MRFVIPKNMIFRHCWGMPEMNCTPDMDLLLTKISNTIHFICSMSGIEIWSIV